MDSLKCPMCNRKSNEPINLRCDHHPCFQCASQIITIDHERYLLCYEVHCKLNIGLFVLFVTRKRLLMI